MTTDRRVSLIRLLDAYAPADARESGHHRRIRDLVARAPDPFARDAYDPGHLTSSAFILSPEEDALLLVFHAKLAKWLQPGGHIDPRDADVCAAARREAREEAGVERLRLVDTDALFDLDVHSIPARGREPAHEHFDVRWLFVAEQSEVTAASDALEVRWFALDEIEPQDADESVVRALAKIRRMGAPPRRDPRARAHRATE
jgi:8-oxo-dGTP pyrophosphatase MutT (NUDIX family)